MATSEEGLNAEIGITLGKLQRQLAAAEARMVKATNKIEEQGNKATRSVSRGFDEINRGAKRAATGGGGMRMVAMQLSQVAQQGAATGNYMQALSIQLPDLMLGFGALGVAIGAASAVLAPFAMDLLFAGDSAKPLEERVSDLASSVDRYKDAAARAAMPTVELRDKYGEAADEARRLFEAEAALARLDVMSDLRDARAGLVEMFGSVEGISEGVVTDLDAALQRVDEMKTALKAEQGGNQLFGEGRAAATESIRELAQQIGRAREAIGRINEEFGLTEDQAASLLVSMIRLRDASSFDEQADAVAQIRQQLLSAVDASGTLSDRQKEVLVSLIKSEQGLRDFVASMAEGGEETRATRDAARDLRDEIGAAAVKALELAGVDMTSGISAATIEAAKLAGNLGIALNAAMSLQNMRGAKKYSGRGGDPRQWMEGGSSSDYESSADYTPVDEIIQSLTPKSSSGGGGSSASTFDPLADLQAQNDRIAQQNDLIGESRARVAELTAKWSAFAAAKAHGVELTDEMRAKIEEEAAEIGRSTAELEKNREARDKFEQAIDDIAGSLADVITEGQSFREAMANIFRSLANDIIKSGIKEALTAVFDGFDGGSGGGGTLGDIIVGFLTGRKALGGGVQAGKPYLVNENTPNSEVFVPSQNGAILNVPQAQRALSAGQQGGGGQASVIVTLDNEMLDARIDRQSRGVAVQVTRQGLGEFSRAALPGRVSQISNDPRRRG